MQKLENINQQDMHPLFSNGINESVYDSLVDKINSNLYRFHEYMEYKNKNMDMKNFICMICMLQL